MFKNPLLHELEFIYRKASLPEHSVFGDDEGRHWYDRFHSVTALGLNLDSADAKKVTEANRLILFALAYPGFPDAAITAKENPGAERIYPDFILTTTTRRIGVELRDVYVELQGRPKMKGQEYLKDRIVEKAHEVYKNARHPPVTASFLFDEKTAYRQSDTSRLAQQLVKCVPISLASNTDLVSLNRHDIRADWLLNLISVIGRSPSLYEPQDGRWEVSHSGSVYPSEKFFQSAIDHKDGKLAGYRNSGCDEFWLLLVIPGFDASGFMCEPNSAHKFNSSFDRIFVFWPPQMKVTELPCSR
jgi:hypothetical protein